MVELYSIAPVNCFFFNIPNLARLTWFAFWRSLLFNSLVSVWSFLICISVAFLFRLFLTIFRLFILRSIKCFRMTGVCGSCSCIIFTFFSFVLVWLLFRFRFMFNNGLWVKIMLLLHFSSVFNLCHLDVRQFRFKISNLHFFNLSLNFPGIQRLVLFVVITFIINFRFFSLHAQGFFHV